MLIMCSHKTYACLASHHPDNDAGCMQCDTVIAFRSMTARYNAYITSELTLVPIKCQSLATCS